jgi:TetR/AcrR family transcriptional repressor of mexJK operon
MDDSFDTEVQALPPMAAKTAGRPRASEVEARAQELIHTAGCLFLKHGYAKVSLEMIAREAHVAVRTIYVKFGGKAGLLAEVMVANRDRFFNTHDMETDRRPVKVILDDFAVHFLDLVNAPEAITLKRMVIAEAPTNPELAQAFYQTGPQQTRDMLERFLARPDIRSQLRDDIEIGLLPGHLLSCIVGDQFARFLFEPEPIPREQTRRELGQRLRLFYLAALRNPG